MPSMVLRFSLPLCLSLSFTPGLASQNQGAAPGGTPAVPAAKPEGAKQDPDRPSKSPAERIEELRRTLQQLANEIAFVESRASSTTQLLSQKFAQRGLQVRAIDAGQTASVMPTLVSSGPAQNQPRAARLLEDKEKAAFGADVLMSIDGSPVKKADFDNLVQYLMQFPSAGDRQAIDQRAALELVRIHTLLAAFPETVVEAETNMKAAVDELQKGTEFTEVLNRYGAGPNMAQGGKVQITRFCPYGLQVEQAAMAAKEGTLTAAVRGLTGLVVMKVEKVNKGQTAQADSADVQMLMIPYHLDQTAVDKHRGRAALGQVDVAVSSPDVYPMLPGMLRPQAKPTSEDAPIRALTVDPAKEEPVKEAPKPNGGN